jgi:hypothetical protein
VQEDTGARLVVAGDDGRVHMYAPSRQQYAAAEAALEGLTGADVRVRAPFLLHLAARWLSFLLILFQEASQMPLKPGNLI